MGQDQSRQLYDHRRQISEELKRSVKPFALLVFLIFLGSLAVSSGERMLFGVGDMVGG